MGGMKMALQIEKRIEKLETALRMGEKPETLEDMFQAFDRGDYGPDTVMSITAAILANGGSGEHLRGKGLPDQLINFFVETVKKEIPKEKEANGR
jgi:hypothetical protein